MIIINGVCLRMQLLKDYEGDAVIKERIHFDSPYFFDINDVLGKAIEENEKMIDTGEKYATGEKKGLPKKQKGL